MPAAPTPTMIPACADESTMELDRPGEERKNRRDAMADDSPESTESAEAACSFATAPSMSGSPPLLPPSRRLAFLKRAEEEDERGEVGAVEVDAADVEASSDGCCTGAGAPVADDGRRSRAVAELRVGCGVSRPHSFWPKYL